jgi:hypothetical protein
MVARWAVIRDADDVVDNIIEWDGSTPWTPPAGHYVIAIGDQWCDIGYLYDPDTGTFSPPPPPPEP